MTDLWNVRLVGSVESLSPISVVTPSAEELVRPDGSKYKRVARRSIYQDGIREVKPILPGSTIRGRLRRAAVEVILALGGEKIPLEEWHQNAVGGIKGAGSESGHDILLRQRIREVNPILALYGSGSPWMSGRAIIGDAVPIENIQTDLVGGVRTDDGKRKSGFFELLEEGAEDTWLAMSEANAARTQLKKKAKTLNSELRAARKAGDTSEIERVQAEISEMQRQEEEVKLLSSNPVSMPHLHEAMPAGVLMAHPITLTAVTPAEAGLFVAAMNHMLRSSPHLGQHVNIGYGLFRAEYDVFITKANQSDPFKVDIPGQGPAGTMIADPVIGLSNVPPQLQEFMTEFRDQYEAGAFDFRHVSELRQGACS